jgi:hypothetical protein
MPEPDDTERLRRQQAEREHQEAELADTTEQEDERHTHARRSDKAAYLREKLEEQGRSPDE